MSKKAQIVWEDGIEYIYQSIHFTTAIMKEYYVGDDFVSIVGKEYFDGEGIQEVIQEAGINGFMPQLVQELKEVVIGLDNQKYDGYEFGRDTDNNTIDEVCFYFLIKKAQYHKVMKDIKYWAIAKGFDHLIRFDIKDVQYA